MRNVLAFALFALLLPASASAQNAAPAWTDERVRAYATERAPSVRAARADLDRAFAGRVAGERPPIGNPTVGVMVLPGAPDFGAWTTAVSVGLPIEVSGVRGVWSREAEQGVLAASARLSDATVQAVSAARRARVELAITRSLIEVQTQRLATARESERRVRARSDAGAATSIDVALAERETALAEADLAGAEARASDALSQFRSALDLSVDEAVDVGAPGRPGAVDLSTLGPVLARAMRTRSDVVAYRRDAERLALTESRVGRAAIAPLVVGFEAQQVAISQQDLGISVGASLRWELPLVQRAQGDRAMLRADAATARLSATLLSAQVARDVTCFAQTLARSLAELDALETRAIPAAERLNRATEAAFAAGALDSFRVLVARNELLQLRARALDALRAAWNARFDYERAVGVTPTD
ncbi:MAG: TolC family protein [Polyangiales bacterium]